MRQQVFATTQFEAYHHWEDAPDQVHFLRNTHRHIFHVKVTLDVEHDDRDIEFIMLKHDIERYTKEVFHRANLDQSSCEMMAQALHRHLLLCEYDDPMTIEVSEDGENGAILTWA